MKSILAASIVTVVTCLTAEAFAISTPECTLYNPPNAPLEMKNMGESDISANFPGALVRQGEKTIKYSINGFSVELRTAHDCSIECSNTKEILVTKNGMSVFTSAEAETLKFSSAVSFYPTLKFIEAGKELTVQCSYTTDGN